MTICYSDALPGCKSVMITDTHCITEARFGRLGRHLSNPRQGRHKLITPPQSKWVQFQTCNYSPRQQPVRLTTSQGVESCFLPSLQWYSGHLLLWHSCDRGKASQYQIVTNTDGFTVWNCRFGTKEFFGCYSGWEWFLKIRICEWFHKIWICETNS